MGNVMDGKNFLTSIKLKNKFCPCCVTRVYYQDYQDTRLIWVDVKLVPPLPPQADGQETFVKIALEHLHHTSYQSLVRYAYLQEEIDLYQQRQSLQKYRCDVLFQLTQEYYDGGIHYNGVVAVRKAPTHGRLYIRTHIFLCKPIASFSFIGLEQHRPATIMVKDAGEMVLQAQIVLGTKSNGQPNVIITGGDGVLSLSASVNGVFYSGRQCDKKSS